MPEHDNIIEFHASCAMLRRVGLLERVSALHISPSFSIFLLSTQAAHFVGRITKIPIKFNNRMRTHTLRSLSRIYMASVSGCFVLVRIDVFQPISLFYLSSTGYFTFASREMPEKLAGSRFTPWVNVAYNTGLSS